MCFYQYCSHTVISLRVTLESKVNVTFLSNPVLLLLIPLLLILQCKCNIIAQPILFFLFSHLSGLVISKIVGAKAMKFEMWIGGRKGCNTSMKSFWVRGTSLGFLPSKVLIWLNVKFQLDLFFLKKIKSYSDRSVDFLLSV